MRLILTILLFSPVLANATNYYVSNSGNDSNNGLTTGASWQHISKVNSTATTGDSVFFNRGNSWNEQIIPAANNIYYGSYGTGAKPIITGFQNQSGWTNIGGNIWRTIAGNAVSNLNMVLVNGNVVHKARFPNSGYLTFTSYSVDSSITGSLTGTPNYTGFEIAVRTVPWIIDVVKVQSQTGGTLKLSPHITYPPAYGGNGYFFQNDSTLVDTLNEYSYNSETKALIVYSVGTPIVKISTIDTLVKVRVKSNISFYGLQFEGANKNLILADSSSHITVNNCNLFYSGGNGLRGRTSMNVTMTGDSIVNILGNATMLNSYYTKTVDCDNFISQNNYIKNIGILPGMGTTYSYYGTFIVGNNSSILNNRIDSVGYIPIYFIGKFSQIKNNYITNYCFTTNDGGGIYSANGAIADSNYAFNCDSGSIVRNNIIDKGIGAIAGTTNGAGVNIAAGIYMDEAVSNVLVDSNTISNTLYAGLFNHNSNNITMPANTVVSGSQSTCFIMSGTNSLVYSNTARHNLFYANDSTRFIFERAVADNGEYIDSNYYSRWTKEGSFMMNQGSAQTLTQWSGATIYDKHSKPTPLDVTFDTPLFYSNPSSTPLEVQLGQTYTDFYGNVANSVTIQPFKSVILFKTINQIPPPAPPAGVFTTLPNANFKIH